MSSGFDIFDYIGSLLSRIYEILKDATITVGDENVSLFAIFFGLVAVTVIADKIVPFTNSSSPHVEYSDPSDVGSGYWVIPKKVDEDQKFSSSDYHYHQGRYIRRRH